ncbi:hypothetical protein E2320_014459 [Naja naja]|nr:hypothetical protein E2320_014459 [Naja naja]
MLAAADAFQPSCFPASYTVEEAKQPDLRLISALILRLTFQQPLRPWEEHESPLYRHHTHIG